MMSVSLCNNDSHRTALSVLSMNALEKCGNGKAFYIEATTQFFATLSYSKNAW